MTTSTRLNKSHIALLMMVKNESKRILQSLKSVMGTVKSVVIYDTGSTDNTIDIIRDFCESNMLPLHLKSGIFEDFSTSRNVSLDFADQFSEIDYLLLLDGNDELKRGDLLQSVADNLIGGSQSGFMLSQEWKNPDNTLTRYYNIRFIKARSGWRYKGSVHEYLSNNSKLQDYSIKLDGKITLFQDRKYDIEKSLSRYSKDKELLMKDYKTDPSDGRTLFYLAQTCGCLNEMDECYDFYRKRIEAGGFLEEMFHSYLRLGLVGTTIGKSWNVILDHYICAFELLGRAEPLVELSEYYRSQKMWKSAYMFAKKACEVEYPQNAVLFVDRRLYDYTRWHLLGILAYYDQKYEEGRHACEIAIGAGSNLEIDKNNLKFYHEKLKTVPSLKSVKKEKKKKKRNKKKTS